MMIPPGPIFRLAPLPIADVPASGAEGLTVQEWGLLLAASEADLEVHLEPREMAALGLVLLKVAELRGAGLAAARDFLNHAKNAEAATDA